MAVLETYLHDPEAKLDYSIDWSAWLSEGASIASSSWKLSPDDGIITQETVDLAGKVATCFVSGLSAGTKYTLTNQISTTPNGQIDERSVALKVVDR